jgi:hypothetical protein
MTERVQPLYIVVTNPPARYDPLNQRPLYSGFLTVIEAENYISSLPREAGETAVVYQNVPLDYRPPVAMVKTFDAQKRKRK